MQKNVGGIDKILRISIGLALLAYGLFTQNIIGFLGLVLLVTGLINFCLLYKLFGISTCSTTTNK